MKTLFVILPLFFLLAGCNKPDPHPELKDPVYQDYNSRKASASQALEAEKKTLEGHEQTLAEVIPQTGQIKFARKRLYESKERVTRLQQEVAYLEIKIRSRAAESRKSYRRARETGEDWPNPSEWESYQAERKLRQAKRNWDVKERMSELGFEADSKSPASAEGGGH